MATRAKKVPVKKKKTTKKKAKASKAVAKRGEVVHPLSALRDEVNHLFERFGKAWERFPLWGPSFEDIERPFAFPSFETMARTDVSETDDAYAFTVELPGMTSKDIELTVTEDVLTLKGEKKEEREEKEKDYYLTERRYGSVHRTFRVPSGVDIGQASANFTEGVLTISLPKTKEAKAKKRTIKVGT